jgi:tRNA-2-methylthio-N6-dimethylallyladenosine synthase
MIKTKHYHLETYGCQMNTAESNALERTLKAHGWTAAADPVDADLVVLNSCMVRKTAEDRIWGRIAYHAGRKKKRNFLLAVIGCMAEGLAEQMRASHPEVDLIFGPLAPSRFENLITAAESGLLPSPEENADYEFADFHGRPGEYKAFIPIMHGCNNFCSYCIVPYVRGPEVSRRPRDIFDEISELERRDCKEITLLGQNVNSYHFRENGTDFSFPLILETVAEKSRSVEWIRFLTSHPKDVSKDLIRVMAEHPGICNHLHLPVQHGSDSVLKRMNRTYSAADYRELIDAFRNAIPGISISSDLLIGFPGETEQDLEATLDLMDYAQFQDAFTYYYNPRKGTAAYDYPDELSPEEKLARLQRVINKQREISKQVRQARISSRSRVLVEGISKKNPDEVLARTQKDEMVVFPGKITMIGSFRTVDLISLHGNTFIGREV